MTMPPGAFAEIKKVLTEPLCAITNCGKPAAMHVRHNSPNAPWEGNLCRDCVRWMVSMYPEALFTYGPVKPDAAMVSP